MIAALRDRTFFSLSELNEAVRACVAGINARPFQKRERSRAEELEGTERPCLLPLPPVPYEMVERRKATVQSSCHVSFDGRLYSVPFAYIRREVEICATRHTVTISCGGERICQHQRGSVGKAGVINP